jgi:antitoxin component of RelBE/YafQ-DinJ toxin-antitoxin module
MLSLSGAAWSAGSEYTATDHRIPIEVTAKERNQTLYEMREFLHGIHNILYAFARNDMKAVAIEAKPMGQALDRIPPGIRDRSPEAFMQMGLAMHEAFNQLGKIAQNQGDSARAQEQMAEIMTYCSGCHDTYRFEVVPYKVTPKRSKAIDQVNPYLPK